MKINSANATGLAPGSGGQESVGMGPCVGAKGQHALADLILDAYCPGQQSLKLDSFLNSVGNAVNSGANLNGPIFDVGRWPKLRSYAPIDWVLENPAHPSSPKVAQVLLRLGADLTADQLTRLAELEKRLPKSECSLQDGKTELIKLIDVFNKFGLHNLYSKQATRQAELARVEASRLANNNRGVDQLLKGAPQTSGRTGERSTRGVSENTTRGTDDRGTGEAGPFRNPCYQLA